MQEIITLSVSHRANHLTTQFFNCQEQSLYNPGNEGIDPSINLNPTIDRISRTVSYTPRALLWEARMGTGSLGTYQYIPETQDFYDSINDNNKNLGNQLIKTNDRIPRSDYQNALDSNGSLPKLTKENTKYWSDYNKLIYQPLSFNTLKDWYHDVENPNFPDYHNLKQKQFEHFTQGVQEFAKCKDEFFDHNFRLALEECDTLQGLNIVTDSDSGWGGFTTGLLEEIRDEIPKSNILTWAFCEEDLLTGSKTLVANKIRSINSFRKESDLVLPILADVNGLSNWEIGGRTCRLFDTISALFSQTDLNQKRSMAHLIDCLTAGDEMKNIVTSIKESNSDLSYSFLDKMNPYGKNKSKKYHQFDYALITRGTKVQNKESKPPGNSTVLRELREFHVPAYNPSDTVPVEFASNMAGSINFEVTEQNRDVFKHWADYVSRYFRFDDDREELKDDLETTATAYEEGWYDDEDSGDDY